MVRAPPEIKSLQLRAKLARSHRRRKWRLFIYQKIEVNIFAQTFQKQALYRRTVPATGRGAGVRAVATVI